MHSIVLHSPRRLSGEGIRPRFAPDIIDKCLPLNTRSRPHLRKTKKAAVRRGSCPERGKSEFNAIYRAYLGKSAGSSGFAPGSADSAHPWLNGRCEPPCQLFPGSRYVVRDSPDARSVPVSECRS